MSWLDARHGRGGGYGGGDRPHYKTAQICKNGHTITTNVEKVEGLSKFCPTCGVETITQCLGCNSPIRGYHYHPNVAVIGGGYDPGKYCYECGKPYPWTETALKTAADLADESDDLDADDKEKLKAAIQDLTVDSPRTELAGIRYKKLIAKAGPVIGKAINQVVVSIATEMAKKAIGL